MSVVDHFDKAPEAGFSRQWDADSARRQFNVSLILIAALAFAAGLLAFSMRTPPRTLASAPAMSVTQADSGAFGRLVRP